MKKKHTPKKICLEHIVYHNFRQLWLVSGVKLMEINSNGCFPGADFCLPWCCWFTMVKPGEASTIHPKPRAPHEACDGPPGGR